VDPISRVSRSVETLESGSLVAFFGVLLILQNGALSLWATDYRTVPYLAQPVQIGGATVTVSRLLILGIAVIVPFLVHFFLSRTLLGKAIRAVSQDREVGLLLGVNARAIGLLTFGIGAALAGMAGALVSMIYLFTPVVGLIFTVKGFTVMVLGGLGKPLGALGAGLSIGVAEAVISFFVVCLLLGTIWTFNNFNVPFLINQNELETSDILVTALYRAAFEYNRYGFAAMFAFVIFLILLVFSLVYIWRSGTLRGVYE